MVGRSASVIFPFYSSLPGLDAYWIQNILQSRICVYFTESTEYRKKREDKNYDIFPSLGKAEFKVYISYKDLQIICTNTSQ